MSERRVQQIESELKDSQLLMRRDDGTADDLVTVVDKPSRRAGTQAQPVSRSVSAAGLRAAAAPMTPVQAASSTLARLGAASSTGSGARGSSGSSRKGG